MTFENIVQREDDLWWPECVGGSRPKVISSVRDLDVAISRCRKFDVCVQAGGYVGIWPIHAAKFFKKVYTWEPDAVNGECCARNVEPYINIHHFRMGLGRERGEMLMTHSTTNTGKHKIATHSKSLAAAVQTVKVMPLDDLGLTACDLIYLDIEGYELHALEGGRETVEAFHPVIAFEEIGHLASHYRTYDEMRRWLHDRGYRLDVKTGNDEIWVPK